MRGGGLDPTPVTLREKVGHTLDRLPAYHKDRQPFAPMGNLQLPVNLTLLTACFCTLRGNRRVLRQMDGGFKLQAFLL